MSGLALLLVRLAALLVPADQREGWVREWTGELAHRFDPPPPEEPPGFAGRLVLVWRALMALPDAAHLALQELSVDSLLKDLRFALRTLARRPGFTALALVTLALGIGANTAIFTVVDAVLLEPLPYPEPEELVAVWESAVEEGFEQAPASAEDYLLWRRESETFEALAGLTPAGYALTGSGDPEQVTGARVTASFFDVFGVRPLHGRPFGPKANVAGADGVVVLSHGLWKRRYGADPEIVGRTARIDDRPHQVVAVMPEGFRFPSTAELWTPLVFEAGQLEDRNWHFLLTTGRLAEGVGLDAAREEMSAFAARQAETFPESNEGWGTVLVPLHEQMTTQVRSMLLVLLGAVGFVLLIACANVANLLLVRATGRTRELAVRAALGAGKGRLVRQLLTESVLLAGAGAAAGVGLAYLGVNALVAMGPIVVPGGGKPGIDVTVLGATALTALVAGLVFGTAPAAAVWRTDLQDSLREGSRSQTGGAGRRLRSVLVVAEMALALVLVTGAGLMVRSLEGLMDVDVGVDTENVLVAQLSLPQARYPSPDDQVRFWDALLDNARRIPGVEAAALTPVVPPAGGGQFHVRIEGVHDAWTMDLPTARARAVSPGFFDALGIPVLRGRGIAADDAADAPWVVVVDQAFVDAYLAGEDPVGREIRTLVDQPREIVGVVGNVTNTGLGNASGPTTYFPYRQTPFGNTQNLVLRTAGDAATTLPAMRDAVWELDGDLPLVSVGSLEERLASSVADRRFNATLLGLFAALALLLAGVGIYGVMSYAVTERTSEMGLRMALGATGAEVRRMVVRRALLLTAGGIVLGVLAALALARVIEGFLFGVEAWDPLTLAAVACTLCLVSFLASWIPARRASRLGPIEALRQR